MGWADAIVVQAFLTVTVIGACKRVGWISVHPAKIANVQARKVFEVAVWLGDNIVEKTSGAVNEIKKIARI